jgi:cell wall-associated NlpC family hydrolase
VRDAIIGFCEAGLANPNGWNYSQNRPVDVSVNPTGQVTSDCSGSVLQAFYAARQQTGLEVPDPAKQGWSGYGNTDLYEDDHPTVTSGQYLVGDLAHYQGHVTLCIRAGDSSTSSWWSFGSEPPSRRNLYYRSDFRKVVRPPLVT